MNASELSRRLEEEGCNPALYAIGSRGTASDAFCLTSSGSKWKVYYTERGKDERPIFESRNEAEACDFFFGHIMSMRHDHCVGFFRSHERADELFQRLQEFGLSPWRDQIPYDGPTDLRYRVFVAGKEIFETKAKIGEVPIRDA